jgi:hypothetical protein
MMSVGRNVTEHRRVVVVRAQVVEGDRERPEQGLRTAAPAPSGLVDGTRPPDPVDQPPSDLEPHRR